MRTDDRSRNRIRATHFTGQQVPLSDRQKEGQHMSYSECVLAEESGETAGAISNGEAGTVGSIGGRFAAVILVVQN